MIDKSEIIVDKEKIAIVVVGYNKVNGLNRLLKALNDAEYEDDNVPLVISIDASGNQQVYELAKEYKWKHGQKYVNIEKNRLGLKKHIFQCASICKFFRGVVILEDDLMVSPFFYRYCLAALEKYENDEKVAGIALYRNEVNGFVDLPFQPYANGYDVFAWQTVCSWGQLFNERMWVEFTSWLDSWNQDFGHIDMPRSIKEWTRAWSKFYYAYLIENDKYFIFPYDSLTTNFNDAGGEHGGGNQSIVQVSLLQGQRNYQFGDFEELVKYDVYGENRDIPSWLGLKSNDITIDFWGLKDIYNGRYILAPFSFPYKNIKGFSMSMRPWELNIKYGIVGEDIYLYDREVSEPITPLERKFSPNTVRYFLRNFNMKLLKTYMWECVKVKIKNRLHLNG